MSYPLLSFTLRAALCGSLRKPCMASSTAKALAAALCICHGEERLQTHEVRPEPFTFMTVSNFTSLAYVDDLMFFGSQADVSTLIQDLQKDLLLKVTGTLDEGQSSSFLGRNLKRTSTFISVGMSPSYIDAMLELYGLKQCRPALAPGTDALRKQLDCEPLDPEDHKRYRRAVGQLLWLSSVRP